MQHDYKAALEALDKVECDVTAFKWFEKYSNSAQSTTASALRIAEALTREPSDEMCMEGVRGAYGDSSGETINIYSAVFKAMRDQLLKEVE